MALTHTQAVKQAATDAVTAIIGEAVVDGPVLEFYEASDTPGVDTPLVTMSWTSAGGAPAFGAAASSGIATATAIENGVVDHDGTATKFRLLSSDGNDNIQGTVGESGSGADIILNNADLVTSQIVQITSLTYRALPQ